MVCMLGGSSDVEAILSNEIEATIEAQVASNVPAPITCQQVHDEVSKDRIMVMLADQITEGFPLDKKLLRLELREYFQHRDHLTQVDGVPLY